MIRLAEEASAAGEPLDLSGRDLSGVDLGGKDIVWSDVVFARHQGGPAANLHGASFRESRIEGCWLEHADLTGADLRGCHIERCHFRYTRFGETTLSDAHITRSDFYRATFGEHTMMRNTTLEFVSLPTSLAGITGLTWDDLHGKSKRPALVQESREEYEEFLNPTKHHRLASHTVSDALDDRLDDAAHVYRALSGLWASQGEFRDAGRAYVHSRRLERRRAGPGYPEKPLNLPLWIGLGFADALCEFGENLVRIVPWLVAVALIPGLCYWLFGGVHGSRGFGDDLLFSASQLTAATPSRLDAGTTLVTWIRVLQTLAGVSLLGLFGFVLGNKLRNS